MAFANRLEQLLEDYRPADEVNRDHYATIVMDYYALRLLGSAALGRAARGDVDVAGLSVLKVLGSEAEQNALRHALDAAGLDGLRDKALTAPYNPYAPRPFHRQLVRALQQQLRGNDRGRHFRDSAQHHRPASPRSAGALIAEFTKPGKVTTETPASEAAIRSVALRPCPAGQFAPPDR